MFVQACKLLVFSACQRASVWNHLWRTKRAVSSWGGGCLTAAIRKEMDKCGFKDGHLLSHIHQKWGFHDITQLETLANGANGIWAGVCEEGASMGHASSVVTMMNLVRMGNKKVLEKFNMHWVEKGSTECHQNNDRSSSAPQTGCVRWTGLRYGVRIWSDQQEGV